jgi:hypothetical protein
MQEEKMLQALNGAAMLPALACLVLLSLYLCREARRRGLRSMDWIRLPPSMNLVLAMFVFDVGVCLRVMAGWLFYLTGQSVRPLEHLFSVAIFLIIVGLLCKIRALTEPDYGKAPWFIVSALTVIAILLFWL